MTVQRAVNIVIVFMALMVAMTIWGAWLGLLIWAGTTVFALALARLAIRIAEREDNTRTGRRK